MTPRKPIPRDHPDDRHPLTSGDQPLIDPFVADVMTHMLDETERVTQQVMNNYKAQIAELLAELALIKEGVTACYDGPYVPAPDTVLRCLHPSRDRIREKSSKPASS